MYDFWGSDECKIITDRKDANYLYGGSRFIMTEDDIKALREGKIINFSVNDEYGCTIELEGREDDERLSEGKGNKEIR